MLPSKRRAIKGLVIFFSFFVFIIFSFYTVDSQLKPTLIALSDSELRIAATEAISKTVKDELSKNIEYSDFVNVKTNNSGEIIAIELNTIEMNKFGNNVVLRVQDEMKFLGGKGISIPLGVLTKSSLLSYMGPKLKVDVIPTGNVMADFRSELESAGINQTRYRVFITISTSLQIVIPTVKERIDVVSTVPIAETLIVGKVPGSYFNTTPGGFNVPNIVPIPAP
ncbi:sporulation protein YunB [Oxobacter pfennigii]|uniref:Sporulation protein YunB n=1 Tax=Oxobacter pfennigii TaxID=36849 RepID=A0A0P8WRY6_9CLOT|nr:sporulation protein YunB [Oxobacter pfennigii]KPU45338.1 sporulation protein YunB [Oxobacter pfennigii]